MSISKELKDLTVFTSMNDDELEIIAQICKLQKVEKDKIIFKEGSQGEELFIVLKGAVRILTQVTDNVEKTLITLRSGGLFGEMAVITEDYRSASAQAIQDSELIIIKKSDFDQLLVSEISVAKKLLDIFVRILADRLKRTTDLYGQAVDWGLSISGILNLNYNLLINHCETLKIKLLNGDEISGVLLKAEKNNFGSELLIQQENEQLIIIPYSSIASIAFNKTADLDTEV
jgi:signal-transduction protein with cAMP-binding, CBS, and nucleotidyltransferase domain